MGQIYQFRDQDDLFGDLQYAFQSGPRYRNNSRDEQIGIAMQYLQDQVKDYPAMQYSRYLEHGDAFGAATPEEQNRILHSGKPEDDAIFLAHSYAKMTPEQQIAATRAYDDLWAAESIGRSAMGAIDPIERERGFNTLMEMTAGNPYLGPELKAYWNPIGPEPAGFVGPVARQDPSTFTYASDRYPIRR